RRRLGRNIGADIAHDHPAGGEMLGIVGDLLYRLIGGRHVAAEATLGVHHGARRPQLFPDRKRVFGPAWIGVVEIADPIDHRRMFGHHAGGIGHRGRSSCSVGAELDSGKNYSSVTSIAISGQLVCASHALSSRPAGTAPSPTSCALPNSSSSNNSGASDLQRAWPWHLSWSTRIFSLDIASVPFLACAVGRALLPNY